MGAGEERGSLCFLQPILLPGWGCCWTWLPGHRVLQGRVSSWRTELQLLLLAGLRERGSDFPQTSAGSRQKPGLPAPPAGGAPAAPPAPCPLLALHHQTDHPRAEGTPQREGLACEVASWQSPSLAPVQAEAVPLASGPPSLLDPHPGPSAHRPTKAARARSPGVAGRPPLDSAGQCRGQGPRAAPGPYLDQQPEGEEEHSVHGAPRAECPPAGRVRLPLRQNH